eukprot:1573311-Pleurochrysis_carterae.AAC.2
MATPAASLSPGRCTRSCSRAAHVTATTTENITQHSTKRGMCVGVDGSDSPCSSRPGAACEHRAPC